MVQWRNSQGTRNVSSKTTNKSAQRKSMSSKSASPPAKYPRNTVDKSLRIPKAILEQNAGKPCTVKESATFLGVGAAGPYQVEVSSGIKYGFLERPTPFWGSKLLDKVAENILSAIEHPEEAVLRRQP
jgi:hypothetical protein